MHGMSWLVKRRQKAGRSCQGNDDWPPADAAIVADSPYKKQVASVR